MREIGWKSCVLFTYCRQDSATFRDSLWLNPVLRSLHFIVRNAWLHDQSMSPYSLLCLPTKRCCIGVGRACNPSYAMQHRRRMHRTDHIGIALSQQPPGMTHWVTSRWSWRKAAFTFNSWFSWQLSQSMWLAQTSPTRYIYTRYLEIRWQLTNS